MKRLAVALVGCGNIAFAYDRNMRREGVHTHSAALAASESFELVAVCDPDRSRAEECARAHKVPAVYDSMDALMSSGTLDVIAICTPDATHAALGKTALTKSGLRALVVEKPIATSHEEAVSLTSVAKARGVAVAVNYSRRYAAGIQRLRDHIRAQKIRAVTGTYTKGIRHNGTHWLDLAEYLGARVQKLSARNALEEKGPDPTLDVQFEFAHGASGFLKGCAEEEYSLFEMDILTDQGRYTLTDFGHQLNSFRAAASPTRTGYRELIPEGMQDTSLRNALPSLWRDVADALNTGRAPLSNAENASRALQLAELAAQSAATGTAVSAA